MNSELRITEVFFSLQGESTTTGLPTIFVRLTGCPLRCNYCDSEYAFTGGTKLTFLDILKKVESYPSKVVCITGGEPLSQPSVHNLIKILLDKGYYVSIETSGALDVSEVDKRAVIVMDLKTPSSSECGKNLYSNVRHLATKDQIKFVIADRADYDWAKFKLDEFQLLSVVDNVLFSPSYEKLKLGDLAKWILADGLKVRMQLQMHKYIWGDKPGV